MLKVNQTIKPYLKYSLIIIGVFWAYSQSWLTDDIFITFRYISNLFAGNGLVYNAGEYVEGYTHPLWLLMLIPFYPNLEIASQVLGLLSFAGLIYFLTRSGWLAAALVVCNMEMRIWATGGLETMLFTFLVFLSVWATLEKKSWTGWILLAMILTRPDGLLISGVILLFNWRYYKPLLLLTPLLALRYYYYGDLLPNPYYAKSGGGSYFSQGFYYIWVYVSVYVSTFLVLYGFRFTKRREIILPMVIIFVYLILFVARVGGDFMYARFIIPVVPLIYFVIEQSFKEFKNTAILVAILFLSFVSEHSLRWDLFYDEADNHKPAFELDGITDEYWYWGQKNDGMTPIDINRIAGQKLKKAFNGRKFCVLLRGQASLGYYGDFYNCIENAGLTDKYIAKQKLMERGRVGHEKGATLEYMKQRKVNFVFNRTVYDTSNTQLYFNLGEVRMRAEVITFDSLVKSLW
jgi:arabinofuranosyltransferase